MEKQDLLPSIPDCAGSAEEAGEEQVQEPTGEQTDVGVRSWWSAVARWVEITFFCLHHLHKGKI